MLVLVVGGRAIGGDVDAETEQCYHWEEDCAECEQYKPEQHPEPESMMRARRCRTGSRCESTPPHAYFGFERVRRNDDDDEEEEEADDRVVEGMSQEEGTQSHVESVGLCTGAGCWRFVFPISNTLKMADLQIFHVG